MGWRRERPGHVGSCGQGVGSWSDDRARGVGGRRGAEVKVTGRRGRGGRGGTEGRGPPPLLRAPSSLGAGSWALPSSALPSRSPRPVFSVLPASFPVNKVSPPLTAERFSNRAYFLYTKAFLFLPPYHCLPNPPIFLSLISSPSLKLLLPPPSSPLQIPGHDLGHDRGFQLSPFFQFSELKPHPRVGNTDLQSEG